MISGGCFALLYPRVRQALGHGGIFALGYAGMALGFFLLPLSANTSWPLAAALLIGAGYALVSPGFIALALTLAPSSSRGLAGGVLTASIFLGQFGSPLISTPLIAVFGYGYLFRGTALLLAIMALSGVLAASIAAARSKA
jgi:MFS family permease